MDLGYEPDPRHATPHYFLCPNAEAIYFFLDASWQLNI